MISKHAIVESARVGRDVRVDEFSIVREGATLGDRVVIHPHCVISTGVVLGDDVEVFPGTFIGKPPRLVGGVSRPTTFDAHVLIGAGGVIGPRATIFFDVEIGDETLVGDGASIREGARIGNRCLISRYVTLNYEVTIGDGTKVMDNTHLTGKTVVGRGVFISAGVLTANDDDPLNETFEEGRISGPLIEDRAFVAAGAIVLPGVRVGPDAVVAAGAVVTADVADGVTVMGIPARPVRGGHDGA